MVRIRLPPAASHKTDHHDRASNPAAAPHPSRSWRTRGRFGLPGIGHQWRASSQLKIERVHHRIYEARGEARRDLFQYIEGFYNSRRLHRP